MLFRKQNIVLIIAWILLILLFFMPFIKLLTPSFMPLSIYDTNSPVHPIGWLYTLMVDHILMVLLIPIIIYYVKNLVVQLRLNAVAFFLNVLLLLGMLLIPDIWAKNGFLFKYDTFGVLIPIISFIMIILANKYIRSDIQKISSASRLR
ncbi:MAG: DUF4293 family protein [Bacteroidales bacterium]|jgi:hypothetical protein|nr:DUF4293 family protein [Bacteroidales bacterium]MDI3479470.1 hypothetical protein [Rikenellaceae bacterium]